MRACAGEKGPAQPVGWVTRRAADLEREAAVAFSVLINGSIGR